MSLDYIKNGDSFAITFNSTSVVLHKDILRNAIFTIDEKSSYYSTLQLHLKDRTIIFGYIPKDKVEHYNRTLVTLLAAIQ